MLAALAVGCAKLPQDIGVTFLHPATLVDLQRDVLARKPDFELFRPRGPYATTTHKDLEIAISPAEHIAADLYSPVLSEKAPLVVFLHGLESSKEAHAYQAVHVATWGMYALSVQLPNTGPWTVNGRTLAHLVEAIHRKPELVARNIDVDRIILIGHSFGASSVAMAIAQGAPAVGAILLDAAGIGRDLPASLRQIRKPVLLLGADEEATNTRNRDYFHRYIPSAFSELSIRGAAHEDGQYPSEASLHAPGLDSYTTEEMQITFVNALTAAAFSLWATGGFDYAWESYRGAFDSGKFFNAIKKTGGSAALQQSIPRRRGTGVNVEPREHR